MKIKELLENQNIIQGDVRVPYEATELEYEGTIIEGNFDCSLTKITSLQGAPSEVRGWFGCSDTRIKSLEGCPSRVGGHFSFGFTKVWTLHNVHKQIKYIGNTMHLSDTVISHILGIVYIKGLKKIRFASGMHSDKAEKQNKVEAIVNRHLPGGNVHDVQEELLEAGLKEYAQL